MKKLLCLCLFSLIFSSCAVTRKVDNEEVQLKFLDEYVLPRDVQLDQTIVGGLSGIDYKNGKYYLVSDQSSNPRIYIADIKIRGNTIDTINIQQLISIKKPAEFSDHVLDLEAIRYTEQADEFIVASEGLINEGKDPGIFKLSGLGEIKHSFEMPAYFKTGLANQPRNNAVFEGLTESFDKKAYWVAIEYPLEEDSSKSKIYPSRTHTRITKFDKTTGLPIEQFAYQLDGISKLPINYFAVNGITEILEYSEDKFLILERAYSAGYGSNGNTVKIFAIDATKASNTLELEKLKGEKYKLASKKLIFNFKSVKDRLTKGIVDNIEGMCFGPELENGKRSLILVSDNNFNSFAEQLNQFILMQIDFKEPFPVTK